MQHHVMIVGIGGADKAGRVSNLLKRLGVLLADIPFKSEVMGETGDHLAQIGFALNAELTAVQRLFDALAIARAVVVLGLLKLEVQVHPF